MPSAMTAHSNEGTEKVPLHVTTKFSVRYSRIDFLRLWHGSLASGGSVPGARAR